MRSSRLTILGVALSHAICPSYGVECDPVAADCNARSKVLEKSVGLPMSFESQTGQTQGEAKFLSRGPGYTLSIAPTEAVLRLRSRDTHLSGHEIRGGKGLAGRWHPEGAPQFTSAQAELRMGLLGANPEPTVEGLEELPGTVNYFIGDQPQAWRVGIPTYGKVRCREVYPGVDLIYYGHQQQLEYDFVVSANTDPGVIGLRFKGAEGIAIDGRGELVVQLQGGEIRWRKPFAYQSAVKGVREIACCYVIKGDHQVGFKAGAYDQGQELIIDPVLAYATYLGGSDTDFAAGIAVDNSGNVYVTGDTSSTDFPATNNFLATAHGTNNVFVAKLNSTGTALLYSAYLGGSDDNHAGGIAVDSGGNAYLVGYTFSTNFPTWNAYQTANAGPGYADVFVAKLGPAGTNLLYSSYFGGLAEDEGKAIAMGANGDAYITGRTYSYRNCGFPLKNAFQSTPGGGGQTKDPGTDDAFVAKFSTTSSGLASLVYSSFLGGDSDDSGNAIAVDTSGNAYVAGDALSNTLYPAPPSSTFPTTPGAFQMSFNGGGTNGFYDAFLTKINAAGSGIVFSTFLGGDGDDVANGIAVDASGKVYVTGQTSSYADFPILTNAVQLVAYAYYTAFVTVFSGSGSSLFYSTYLGGSAYDYGNAIAVDNFGEVYVTGGTSSYDFPVTVGADQTNLVGFGDDASLTKINPAVFGPAGLVYSSYLGGSDSDFGTGIAVGADGNFYVGGSTASINFPTTAGVFRGTNSGGGSDAFVAKFRSPPDLSVTAFVSPRTVVVGSNLTCTIHVCNNGRSTFSGVSLTNPLPAAVQFFSAANTHGNYVRSGNVVIFNFSDMTNNASAIATLVATAVAPGRVTNSFTLNAVDAEPNTANNTATVTFSNRGIADLSVAIADAPDPVLATSNLTYTIGITNQGPWPATAVVLSDSLPSAVSYVSATASQGTCTTNAGTVTCNLGTLANGAGAVVTIKVAALTYGLVNNSASATAFELDPSTANNTATVATTITPLADVAITSVTGLPNPVFASSNLAYTINLTNRGPSVAPAAVLTDPLPPGAAYVSAVASQGSCTQYAGVVTCNLGDLTNGRAATVTIIVKPALDGAITNTASVTAAATDYALANNTATVATTVNPLADVAITSVTGLPNPVFASSNLAYTINLTNRGPSVAPAAVLTDPLPPGAAYVSAVASQGSCTQYAGVVTCNLGDLTNGRAATVTIVAKPALDGAITNTASVTAAAADYALANNTATVVTTVNPLADLAVLKVGAPNPVPLLSNLTYTITVTNRGPSVSTGVVLTDSLPPDIEFVSAQTTQGTCVESGGVITCNLGDLTNGAAATVTVVIRALWEGSLNNTASISAAVTDPTAANNAASSAGTVVMNAGGPLLRHAKAGTNIVLYWSTNNVGFALQSATSVAPSNTWSIVSNVPAPIDRYFYVTNDIGRSRKYYRLFE